MPVKNRIKTYVSGGVYHIYNRGLDGRTVFLDAQDYEMWIRLMERYLGVWSAEIDERYKTDRPYILRHKQKMNLNDKVKVFAYCLMPDHFHFLVRQDTDTGITQLMRRLLTNYVMYFNRKYKRHGMLFENVYRAILLPDELTTVWLSKYIHTNPAVKSVKRFGLVETSSAAAVEYYPYSSYQNYLQPDEESWVDVGWLMKIFRQVLPEAIDYKNFVENDDKWKLPDLTEFVLEK